MVGATGMNRGGQLTVVKSDFIIPMDSTSGITTAEILLNIFHLYFSSVISSTNATSQ